MKITIEECRPEDVAVVMKSASISLRLWYASYGNYDELEPFWVLDGDNQRIGLCAVFREG